MQYSKPGDPPIVGFTWTANIAGLAPSTEDPAVIRSRKTDCFRSMAAGPNPSAAVIEDTDYPSCIAGWWGVHAVVFNLFSLSVPCHDRKDGI
ncbi:MAG: hypothetical protein V7742_05835 [Halioglobus sp.]